MAKIKVARRAGEPGIKKNVRTWTPIRKPMRAIRSVRTLIKRDESNGVTMPEAKNLLQRAGVGTRQQSPTVMKKGKVVSSGKNLTRMKTPSTTNSGGVRSPFRRGRGS